MATSAQASTFFTLLEAEKQLLEKFVLLLKDEQAVLVNGGKENLTPLTQNKVTLADTLTQQGEKRSAFMSTAGIPLDRNGLNQWLGEQTEPLQTLWRSFIELAGEAKTLNDLNGRLVAERLSNNQQAIQTLMSVANRPATYGPDGQTSAIAHGRTLGSA